MRRITIGATLGNMRGVFPGNVDEGAPAISAAAEEHPRDKPVDGFIGKILKDFSIVIKGKGVVAHSALLHALKLRGTQPTLHHDR